MTLLLAFILAVAIVIILVLALLLKTAYDLRKLDRQARERKKRERLQEREQGIRR